MTAEEARTLYLDAALRGSRREAFGVVETARAAGVGVREMYLEVFQPVLRELGRLWQENRITVAEEHLATAVTQAAMGRLADAVFAGAAQPGPLLVAACAEGERHELGLRMVCDVLEMEGWDTVFLGAAVPVEDLVTLVRERRPRVVALSAALPAHVPRVRRAVEAIRAAAAEAPPLIAVGGRAFADDPALAAHLGADLTAEDAAEAAERLMQRFPG